MTFTLIFCIVRVKLEMVLSIIFIRHCSVVVITSASHAEGPQFEPGQCHSVFTIVNNVKSFIRGYYTVRKTPVTQVNHRLARLKQSWDYLGLITMARTESWRKLGLTHNALFCMCKVTTDEWNCFCASAFNSKTLKVMNLKPGYLFLLWKW